MLSDAVARGEHEGDAWLWQIRIDVLDYVLHQYGSEASPVGHSTREKVRSTIGHAQSPDPHELAFDPPKPSRPAEGLPPVDTSKLRQWLQSLRETNDQVRADRPMPFNLPPPVSRFYNRANGRWVTWDPREESRLFAKYVEQLDEQAIEAINLAINADLGLPPSESATLDPQLIRAILREHGLGEPDAPDEPAQHSKAPTDA